MHHLRELHIGVRGAVREAQKSQKPREMRAFKDYGRGRIRTFEGISHQIYSLTRLPASVTPRHEQLSVEPPRRGPTRRITLHPSEQSILRSTINQNWCAACHESRWSEHFRKPLMRTARCRPTIRSSHSPHYPRIRASGGT